MDMEAPVTGFDAVILTVLLITTARGLYIGLIREGFSIAALAAAVLATRYGTPAVIAWLQDASAGEIGPAAAPWLSGAAIAVVTLGLVTLVGRAVKRCVSFAGLGWADRLGGATVGAAEGVLVAMLIVLSATWMVGREHPLFTSSKSLEAYDLVRSFVDERADQLPDVASPGSWR